MPIPASGLTPTMFKAGDELLLMTGATTTSGRNQMTTVVLTGAGAAGPAGAVIVPHTPTNADGTTPADPAGKTFRITKTRRSENWDRRSAKRPTG